MKKLGISLISVGVLLTSVFVINSGANPLPSCDDEWCHYTHPDMAYHDFPDKLFSFSASSNKDNEWMVTNCPNWPNINDPVFRALNLQHLRRDYERAVDELWLKKNPQETGVTYDGKQEKIREEQYLAAQKEKYGRNIPYCLTEKAQDRVQQARWETEKYLHDATNVPMVRDRVVLLAKIEEANAKTAKELGLENLYKAPPKWQIDKATLDAWWEETHPNGKALDSQAIKQRYKDYFVKQEWKGSHPNEPEPSIEEIRNWGEQKKIQIEQKRQKERDEYKNKIQNFWRDNFPNWPKADSVGFSGETGAYQYYKGDVDDLWLKYHKEPTYTDCSGVCRKRHHFSAPFEEREGFFLNKQKELYGQNIPYCLTGTVQKFLREQKKDTEEYLRGDTANRPFFEENLKGIIAAEQANAQIAAELGLDSLIKNESQDRAKHASMVHLLLAGFIALGIVAMAAIVLLRRKKNLPK